MFKKIIYVGLLAVLMLPVGLSVARVAAADAPDPGLELHWNLDEGSGTVANDASGHGNIGTVYNGATYVPGHDGLAISLDGIDQYVQTDTPLTSLGTVDQPYALSAWVNVPAGVTGGNIVHISSNADGSGWCIPFLRLEGGVFTATGWDNSGEVSAVGTTPVVAGQWYQVLTSWDPINGLRIFVNGTLEQATPQADYAAAGTPIYASVGLSNAGCSEDQGFLDGEVDDVRIYSRALTPDDVQSISTEGDPVVAAPTSDPSSSTDTPPVATLTDTGTQTALTSAIAVTLLVTAVLVRAQGRFFGRKN